MFFLTQSIFSYIIALPIILTNLISNKTFDIVSIILISLGSMIFFIGFIFEVLADHSLQRFKKDPSNKGKNYAKKSGSFPDTLIILGKLPYGGELVLLH